MNYERKKKGARFFETQCTYSVGLLCDREGVGRGGGMGYGTYTGMMSMGRGGANIHAQQLGAGASVRPGSAGSAPAAGFAEPYNYVRYTRIYIRIKEVKGYCSLLSQSYRALPAI